jgi:hypothetical protein
MWKRLPQEVRDRIDAELRHRRVLPAIVLLRAEGGLDPLPGLHEAQIVVLDRLGWLAGQGLVEPKPSVELPQLVAAAEAIQQPVVAVEAVWDGDAQGWFVRLVAIVQRPSQHHARFDEVTLAKIGRGGDIRLFNGEVPPWPEAAEATEVGQALASSLGVPFHFTDSDAPDVELPRWWDRVVW